MANFSLHKVPGWIVCSIPAVFLNALSYHRYGPGMSPDSVSYLSAAQSFKTSGVFLGVDGLPLTNWPPLYPFLLSLVNGAILNQLALVMCAFLIWMLLQQAHHRTLLTTIAVVSLPMLKLSSMVWSEPLFLCLLLGVLLALKAYNNVRSTKWLMTIGVLLALLCLQRYVGLFFAATLLLLALRHRQFKLSVTVVMALLPLVAWFMRNHAVKSNTPFQSFVHWDNGYQNILACFNSVQINPSISSLLSWVIFIIWMGGACLVLVQAIRKPSLTWRTFLQASIMVYLLAILNWAPLSPAEWVRYVLPIFPLLILLLHSAISRHTWLLWTILGLNTITLGIQSYYWITVGAGGYQTSAWKRLPIKEMVLPLPDDSYMSNAPDLIFLETGKRCRFTYVTTEQYPTIVWIKAVNRHSDSYQQFIDLGYFVAKDSAGIQLLTKLQE